LAFAGDSDPAVQSGVSGGAHTTTDGPASSTGGTSSGSPSGPSPSPARYRAPRPFPGFLMIADRGNDRALLVDGSKRVLWRYPRPGHSPRMPFRYDDDVFFTPGYRSIISNQEDQETIEVISFPRGRLLWHYGHVDAVGSAPGYMNNPD